jgi:hypothetical protein
MNHEAQDASMWIEINRCEGLKYRRKLSNARDSLEKREASSLCLLRALKYVSIFGISKASRFF